MSREDDVIAALVATAILQPDFRRAVLADPDTHLAGSGLAEPARRRLLDGLRELDRAGPAAPELAARLGAERWGPGG
jgi:hypothetical protein